MTTQTQESRIRAATAANLQYITEQLAGYQLYDMTESLNSYYDEWFFKDKFGYDMTAFVAVQHVPAQGWEFVSAAVLDDRNPANVTFKVINPPPDAPNEKTWKEAVIAGLLMAASTLWEPATTV